MRWAFLLLPFLSSSSLVFSQQTRSEKEESVILEIENTQGIVLEAEVLSIIRVHSRASWLCFRPTDQDRLYLYPFSSLAPRTLDRLEAVYSGSGLLVADGVTPGQLDFLEKYLAAGPREKLVLEVREARKKERLLEREWKRLQDQTWRLQQQVARTRDAELRKRNAVFFQRSLAARDRVGKQLVLCRAEIRRMQERIELLRNMGVEIEDDPFESGER